MTDTPDATSPDSLSPSPTDIPDFVDTTGLSSSDLFGGTPAADQQTPGGSDYLNTPQERYIPPTFDSGSFIPQVEDLSSTLANINDLTANLNSAASSAIPNLSDIYNQISDTSATGNLTSDIAKAQSAANPAGSLSNTASPAGTSAAAAPTYQSLAAQAAAPTTTVGDNAAPSTKGTTITLGNGQTVDTSVYKINPRTQALIDEKSWTPSGKPELTAVNDNFNTMDQALSDKATLLQQVKDSTALTDGQKESVKNLLGTVTPTDSILGSTTTAGYTKSVEKAQQTFDDYNRASGETARSLSTATSRLSTAAQALNESTISASANSNAKTDLQNAKTYETQAKDVTRSDADRANLMNLAANAREQANNAYNSGSSTRVTDRGLYWTDANGGNHFEMGGLTALATLGLSLYSSFVSGPQTAEANRKWQEEQAQKNRDQETKLQQMRDETSIATTQIQANPPRGKGPAARNPGSFNAKIHV